MHPAGVVRKRGAVTVGFRLPYNGRGNLLAGIASDHMRQLTMYN